MKCFALLLSYATIVFAKRVNLRVAFKLGQAAQDLVLGKDVEVKEFCEHNFAFWNCPKDCDDKYMCGPYDKPYQDALACSKPNLDDIKDANGWVAGGCCDSKVKENALPTTDECEAMFKKDENHFFQQKDKDEKDKQPTEKVAESKHAGRLILGFKEDIDEAMVKGSWNFGWSLAGSRLFMLESGVEDKKLPGWTACHNRDLLHCIMKLKDEQILVVAKVNKKQSFKGTAETIIKKGTSRAPKSLSVTVREMCSLYNHCENWEAIKDKLLDVSEDVKGPSLKAKQEGFIRNAVFTCTYK